MSVVELGPDELWYCGFADVNGMQFFIMDLVDTYGFGTGREQSDVDAEKFSLCIKSIANQSSQAVVFEAALSNDDAMLIDNMIYDKEGNFKGPNTSALKLLKEKAKSIKLSTYKTTIDIAKKNWDITTSL